MIEITLHSPSTILIDGATRFHGSRITNIPGREFIKSGSRWIVPLSRLGDVIKIAGVQNVSLDYAVLVARDKQLQRMVDQYASRGVRIWRQGCKVVTDNDLLTKHLQPMAELLAPFLGDTEPPRRTIERKPVQVVAEPEPVDSEPFGQLSLDKWLVGVQNAAANEEKARSYRKVRR